jgi:hypothetical protein
MAAHGEGNAQGGPQIVSRLQRLLPSAGNRKTEPCSPCQAPTVLAEHGLSEDAVARHEALHLATALPRSVALEHLLPSLQLTELLVLRATFKAMRALVADLPGCSLRRASGAAPEGDADVVPQGPHDHHSRED